MTSPSPVSPPDFSVAPDSGLALPPETLEGWYALHQIFRVERPALRQEPFTVRGQIGREAKEQLTAWGNTQTGQEDQPNEGGGWSGAVKLIGSEADVMLVHFRPTLDAIGEVQQEWRRTTLAGYLTPVYTFLSVTEAGLYHITAAVARERAAAGGFMGDAEFRQLLAARASVERNSPHVTRRLYPRQPADMPYVCFYPMSKRRAPGQNWYALSLDERSRLMHTHGLTGRRYAGKIAQVITGAIGLDAWEWGVTLFGRDPLDFKKLVTDMRFDEVSAQYADFGNFYVGRMVSPAEWVDAIL